MRCSFHSRLKYNQHKIHIFCAYLLNQCKYYYYNITKHKNYLSYSATFCMFLLLLFPCRDFLFQCNYTGTGCYYYTGTEQCYNYIDTGLSLDGLCSKFYLFFNSFKELTDIPSRKKLMRSVCARGLVCQKREFTVRSSSCEVMIRS